MKPDNLSIGAYRLNYFELLLSMAAGHIVIGNPFFGAAVFLFADIFKAYALCNIQRIRRPDGSGYLPKLFLTMVLVVGAAVAFLYPALKGIPKANIVSLFALCIVARDYLCATPVLQNRPRGALHALFIAAAQIVFDFFCVILVYGSALPLSSAHSGVAADDLTILTEPGLLTVSILVVLTGLHKVFLPDKSVTVAPKGTSSAVENKFGGIASYRIFTNMSLYSTIAMNLGVMIYLCNPIVSAQKSFDIRTYAALAVWLLVVNLILLLCDTLIRKRWLGLALAEFISGVITWVLGAVFMFRAEGFVPRMLWTFVWGMGMALISSSISRFNLDFAAVGRLSDENLDSDDLVVSNVIVTLTAAVISSFIMLVVMAVWTFASGSLDGEEPSLLHKAILMASPVLFMGVALGFALRQPLDYRNREKLMLYISNRSSSEKERESLRNLFVRKYRMRFGVKILLTLARPFLRLRVSGLKNLRQESYPSVFVCNHGFIYGPIAAVIYLPTYFRPWIHNVMLDKESAFKEMSLSLRGLKKIFGSWLIRILAKGTCWALNSFNPIPVSRGVSREVMMTFSKSSDALAEGDNILIFPEKPTHLTNQSKDFPSGADSLRTFYTGFAHVGKMYYDKTGKRLLFYPLFSDKDSRQFKIGEPVEYNPDLGGRESKVDVAERLQKRMAELCGACDE